MLHLQEGRACHTWGTHLGVPPSSSCASGWHGSPGGCKGETQVKGRAEEGRKRKSEGRNCAPPFFSWPRGVPRPTSLLLKLHTHMRNVSHDLFHVPLPLFSMFHQLSLGSLGAGSSPRWGSQLPDLPRAPRLPPSSHANRTRGPRSSRALLLQIPRDGVVPVCYCTCERCGGVLVVAVDVRAVRNEELDYAQVSVLTGPAQG
jgi:hypothetical protein